MLALAVMPAPMPSGMSVLTLAPAATSELAATSASAATSAQIDLVETLATAEVASA